MPFTATCYRCFNEEGSVKQKVILKKVRGMPKFRSTLMWWGISYRPKTGAPLNHLRMVNTWNPVTSMKRTVSSKDARTIREWECSLVAE
mmetsp:Transcript_18205/g.37627  ORF Transcript_18205/g.37627 Transcript_18205/m.37627 type:complete len:89 (+) Transcript_18205:86-352(+)